MPVGVLVDLWTAAVALLLGNDLTSLKSRPALELGARSGWGTQKLRERGWGNVLGLELSPKAVAFAKAQGRPVVSGDMHSFPNKY